MTAKKFLHAIIFLLFIIATAAMIFGICRIAIPDTLTVSEAALLSAESSGSGKTYAKLLGVPIKEVSVSSSASEKETVYLGGDAIGVKFYAGGVLVVGLSEVKVNGEIHTPAKDAGLEAGDLITKANGVSVETSEALQEVILSSGSGKITVSYKRNGEERQTDIYPVKNSDGNYKSGMWIRDSSAGIGTVSYVTSEGIFASLGHGITDIDTGLLMPLSRGSSVEIKIEDAQKGKANAPGELKGTFGQVKTGVLISNTDSGLYGSFTGDFAKERTEIEIGSKENVRVGKAQIVSTVDESGPRYFDAEIVQIVSQSAKSKNFIIKITDKELLDITGGIIQGMSGSPVIQNGKLVGAVTHVMISDPKKGYGIFIENMLEANPKISG